MNTQKNLFLIIILVIVCGCTASEKTSNFTEKLNAKNVKFDATTYPVVVLGGGVGGLTAAIYLAQAGLEPLVIEGNTPGGLITQSPGVENWPGETNISGFDLTKKIKAQAQICGAKVISQKVASIDLSCWPYKIKSCDLMDETQCQEIKALSCIIVMGSKPNLLNVPGESGSDGFFGKGITTCAICDGALYKGKNVAVIGGGNSAMTESLYLSNIVDNVVIIARSDKLRASHYEQELIKQKPNIKIMLNTKVIQFTGDKKHIKSVLLENTKADVNKTEAVTEMSIDGVFLAIGSTPNTELFKGQLDLTEKGFIKLLNQQQTSKPGIFAAGDIADDQFKQAITAAGDSAKAALQSIEFLQKIGYSHTKKEYKKSLDSHKIDSHKIVEIKNEKKFNKILNQSDEKLIVADFYSSYCIPCKNMAPIFASLAEEFSSDATFVKINVSTNSELAKRFGLESVPTFLFFKGGKIVQKFIGAKNADAMRNEIKRLLK